ncbi:MAG: TRAP transporter small permease [Saccharospirillum sp.]|uniref:TRAP transporter small permease n=1 Tax=Saccharospirillum sp. TaxID=2033801 RepID=UPI003297AC70
MGSLRSDTGVYARAMHGLSLINVSLAGLSAVILLCATLFVFLEIVSRFFFGKSQIWVIEISGYSLLYMTFLGAPYMLEKHRHVAIDILTDALPEPVRTWLAIIIGLTCALACLVSTWFGVVVFMDQWEFGMRETTLLAPKSQWLTIVFPVAMLLMALQFIDQAITQGRSLRSPGWGSHS